MKKIKLYHFNPNGYGVEFFVAETSKENAYNKLIQFLKSKKEGTDADFYQDQLEIWEKININDPNNYPVKYTIDEYNVGEIIISEVA